MPTIDRFSPSDTCRRQRYPLLAAVAPRPCQAGAGARRRALHDSADGGAPEAPGQASTKTWVITNEYLAHEIADQLAGVPAKQIIQEPVARNTAPACGLAAFLIERQNPDAVLGVFPSDHVIADEPRFLKALHKGIALAASGENIVVLGIEPTRPETGYGYIETGDYTGDDIALHVRRFIEKPNLNRAEDFVSAGNYFWNSGMFLWTARTLANAVREHLPGNRSAA